MSPAIQASQGARNEALIRNARYLREAVTSRALPFRVDVEKDAALSAEQSLILNGLQMEAARVAIQAVGALARINEVDHLGGSLDLIPSLLLTLSVIDHGKSTFTIENAHTSIAYYSALSVLGYLEAADVIGAFRRSLDIPGHVSWVPGGTPLNGGRLGVMIPTAVGQALGKKARHGKGTWVICHCGDAGWISGQALNGFNAADLHHAPISFVMQRNGIQLSGSNKQIMNKDPRPIIAALGISILEIPSVHDLAALYAAYREAYALAQQGRPALIYPAGFQSEHGRPETLTTFGGRYGILQETAAFAGQHGVSMDTPVWTPGALMSFRDVKAMLECLFLVNGLPGGEGHHDGHLKGRDMDEILRGSMLQLSGEQAAALDRLRQRPRVEVTTRARPAAGSKNLVLPPAALAQVKLPEAGSKTSPRAGSEAGYAAIAQAFPDDVFVVSCDLDPSTKLGKARAFLKPDHQFEMSIQEQASALLADGLAMSADRPQLNVFSTFAAFFEGIAREGLELWRYQRNLNGANEGLNVAFHMSHVGACTGRDHFSGWSLDWITLAMGYLPYLHRFYAPADARAAFLAVLDLAAHYGGHIIGIPRDNLPVLSAQDGSGPLWKADTPWTPATAYRIFPGAKKAILAFGAPAWLAGEAADALNAQGVPVDVHIVNGLPLEPDTLAAWFKKYSGGLVTVEDGIIAHRAIGLRGFASLVSGAAHGSGVPLAHIGIEDPCIAPSDGHMEVWAHFGITAEAIAHAAQQLRR